MRQTDGLCCVKASMIESRIPVAGSSLAPSGTPSRTSSHGSAHELAFMRWWALLPSLRVTSVDSVALYAFWPGVPQ